jgi:hypothetical protein
MKENHEYDKYIFIYTRHPWRYYIMLLYKKKKIAVKKEDTINGEEGL